MVYRLQQSEITDHCCIQSTSINNIQLTALHTVLCVVQLFHSKTGTGWQKQGDVCLTELSWVNSHYHSTVAHKHKLAHTHVHMPGLSTVVWTFDDVMHSVAP